jgi:hypothetical protein
MKKPRRTLLIVLPALAILGTLAVAGHAGKPGKPLPAVALTGGLVGTGDATAIRVTFADSSFDAVYGQGADPTFISNPDGSLTISNAPRNNKTLTYYYCVHPDHARSDDSVCGDPAHARYYYYGLRLLGGIPARKGDNDHVRFPPGSMWTIGWEETRTVVAWGTLSSEVRYDID